MVDLPRTFGAVPRQDELESSDSQNLYYGT